MTKEKKKFSLRPRARIVRTLGEELISSDAIALIELVKNSYDADAHNVTIHFEAPLTIGAGFISVLDDGKGMSPDDLEVGWMQPASIGKLVDRISVGGRPYLGQKGIGRFSAAKLAERMMITSMKEGFSEVYAEFNWNDYYNPEKYLDEINGDWEIRDPEVLKISGTLLTMENLRAMWDEDSIRELSIQLQRLISPVGSPENFRIFLELPEEYSKFSGEVSTSEMLKNPDYTILGELDGSNNLTMVYSSNITKEPLVITKLNLRLLGNRRPECGPLEFEFRVWDRDRFKDVASELGRSLNSVRQDMNSVSGVSIYRDKFRVAPYGNPGDDWLRLDLRRVQSPTMRVSNNQVIGRISISGQGNPELKDQTNREGIVYSQSFEDLREIAKMVLQELENRRYKERRIDSDDDKNVRLMQQKVDLDSVREVIQKKIPDDQEIRDILDKKEAEINEQVGELREVITRYRRLSTMGQLMDVVMHEVGNYILRIKNGARILEREVDPNNDKATRNILNINEGTRLLTDTFKKLEPFGGRRRERATKFIVEDAIKDVFGLFQTELSKLKIEVEIPDTQTTIKISEPELKEIIVNLLTNSIYWFGSMGQTERDNKIIVGVKSENRHIEITFQDNGPGIDEDDAGLIFDPYYTKKPDGIGLGLTIIGEIAAQYNGALELVVGDQTGACFRLKLPIEEV